MAYVPSSSEEETEEEIEERHVNRTEEEGSGKKELEEDDTFNEMDFVRKVSRAGDSCRGTVWLFSFATCICLAA
jgi:hypothetical protein